MKLEYLADGSPETPLIRLYALGSQQAMRLQAVFSELATIPGHVIKLHELTYVEPVDSCRFTLAATDRDQGIVMRDAPASFRCSLTADTWLDLAERTLPLAREGACGFQWLHHSTISWLLSVDGQW
jgi:hypothetical protein